MANSDPVLSVLKALDVLRFVSEAEHPIEATVIADALGMKLTTCYNLLRTLALRGYVVHHPGSGYAVGAAPAELVRNEQKKAELHRGAASLRKLAARFPEAILTLSELTSGGAVCRLRISPDRPGELQRPVDQLFPPYVSVSAICLQALADNAGEFEANFPFAEYGNRKYATLQEFHREQQNIRRQGYFARFSAQDGITAAFYLGGNCAIGFRDASTSEQALPVIQKIIQG